MAKMMQWSVVTNACHQLSAQRCRSLFRSGSRNVPLAGRHLPLQRWHVLRAAYCPAEGFSGSRATARALTSGPRVPEHPTEDPTGKPFDLGPFAFYRVPEGAEAVRLDRWIMKNVCSNWNAAQKLISAKQVWVMSPELTTEQHRGSIMIPRFRPGCQGSMRLKPHDYVYYPKIMRPRPKRHAAAAGNSEPSPCWLVRRLLYKDSDFLAIDKPAGWSVTPGKHVGKAHLQRFLPSLQFGLEEPPRFVHRLSTELSGVLLLARHRAAAAYAKDIIKQRAFWQRSFWAVVCGRTAKSGTVSMPLAKEQHGERMIAKPRREDDGGLPALTEYRSLRFSPLAGGISLLELNPYSGRHHQARAHCAYGLRAPIVGDPLYYDLSNRLNLETSYSVRYHSDDAKKERTELLGPQPHLHLHSRQMLVRTFAGREILVTSPIPPHLQNSFRALGWSEYAQNVDKRSVGSNPWSAEEDPHVMEVLIKASRAERESQYEHDGQVGDLPEPDDEKHKEDDGEVAMASSKIALGRGRRSRR